MSTATYQREREPIGNNTKTQKKKKCVWFRSKERHVYFVLWGSKGPK